MKEIRYKFTGGTPQVVELPDNATVSDLLESVPAAKGYAINIDGVPVQDHGTLLGANARVSFTEKTKGA